MKDTAFSASARQDVRPRYKGRVFWSIRLTPASPTYTRDYVNILHKYTPSFPGWGNWEWNCLRVLVSNGKPQLHYRRGTLLAEDSNLIQTSAVMSPETAWRHKKWEPRHNAELIVVGQRRADTLGCRINVTVDGTRRCGPVIGGDTWGRANSRAPGQHRRGVRPGVSPCFSNSFFSHA